MSLASLTEAKDMCPVRVVAGIKTRRNTSNSLFTGDIRGK
jgi:hypothetical protein